MQKPLFCTRCQVEEPHDITVANNEVIYTHKCGHFRKFDASLSVEEMRERIAAHRKANEGLKLIHTEADMVVDGMTKAEQNAVLAKLESL